MLAALRSVALPMPSGILSDTGTSLIFGFGAAGTTAAIRACGVRIAPVTSGAAGPCRGHGRGSAAGAAAGAAGAGETANDGAMSG